MTQPLHVGVFGLGSLWKAEFLPALRRLRERFRIACLCDAVSRRAMREAKRLGCTAAAGPSELFQRHHPEAVLILDPQWWRLWPLELACQHNVPVLCCPSLELEADRAGILLEGATASGTPVQMALLPRRFPALGRLRELFGTSLGAPKRILSRASAPETSACPALLDLIDCCGTLFQAEPERVQRARADGLSTVVLDYGHDRTAQATIVLNASAAHYLQIEVFAERGWAVLSSPDRLRWQDSSGNHQFRASRSEGLGRAVLEAFHAVALREHPPDPSLAEAYRLLIRVAG